jgi:hypothetical protein
MGTWQASNSSLYSYEVSAKIDADSDAEVLKQPSPVKGRLLVPCD